MPGARPKTWATPGWMPENKRAWLRDNVMCICYEITLMPGTICSYVPRGTVNPDCGCVNRIPPIPFNELKGETYANGV